MADLVKANESTAERRRLYFHLVGTDGISPAPGEAGGQPQISTNGGAWTDTGVGVLVAIGNGRYYADPTQAAVATAGDEIESRYKSASTAECPGTSLRVVAFDPYDAQRLGLASLPNADPGGENGLPILGTNTAGMELAPAAGDALKLTSVNGAGLMASGVNGIYGRGDATNGGAGILGLSLGGTGDGIRGTTIGGTGYGLYIGAGASITGGLTIANPSGSAVTLTASGPFGSGLVVNGSSNGNAVTIAAGSVGAGVAISGNTGMSLIGSNSWGLLIRSQSPINPVDLRLYNSSAPTLRDAVLGSTGLASIADSFLGRNIAGGSDGGRTVKQALAAQRNKVAFDVPTAGQFTVYDVDDTTPLWTGSYTASADANPVTTLDPA